MNASNFKLSVNQDIIFFGVQNLGDLGKENLISTFRWWQIFHASLHFPDIIFPQVLKGEFYSCIAAAVLVFQAWNSV